MCALAPPCGVAGKGISSGVGFAIPIDTVKGLVGQVTTRCVQGTNSVAGTACDGAPASTTACSIAAIQQAGVWFMLVHCCSGTKACTCSMAECADQCPVYYSCTARILALGQASWPALGAVFCMPSIGQFYADRIIVCSLWMCVQNDAGDCPCVLAVHVLLQLPYLGRLC